MKKILSVLLTLSLLLCSSNISIAAENVREFTSLSDPSLLQCVEDSIYAGLVDQFDSEDYLIENVKAIYISQEYLDELAFNSKSNIFFGYTLEELDAQFQGKRYVFTLGDNCETVVEELASYDNTYERIIKNIAVGTGVILVCATVTVVTAGAGLTTISGFFAVSTIGATVEALEGAGFGSIFAGIIEGIRTGDFDSALKAGAVAASEGFKWGAISGTITSHIPTPKILPGGITIADDLAKVSDDAANIFDDFLRNADEIAEGTVEIADDLPAWRKAELRALNEKGGYDQLTFQNRKLVSHGTPGGTRPDVIRLINDHVEAVEVKYYDLSNESCLKVMCKELFREVTDRIKHLPEDSTQRIILDVTDRGFTTELVDFAKTRIWDSLKDVYPSIPIDVVGLVA